MHVRAYNYWVSLLDGRDFPSIEELEPDDVHDFATQQRPARFHLRARQSGGALYRRRDPRRMRARRATRTISDVPSRSLLSRLTDHYLQIIANRAPIGFEAEFVNQRSENICYRGILHALLVGRRHDRFHLRRDQLEDGR